MYCTATLSSVGYGDITACTSLERIYSMLIMVLKNLIKIIKIKKN